MQWLAVGRIAVPTSLDIGYVGLSPGTMSLAGGEGWWRLMSDMSIHCGLDPTVDRPASGPEDLGAGV